jgi:hypothetical protein
VLTFARTKHIINYARAILKGSEQMESPKKIGRPPKNNNPRNCDINIRLTEQESNDIKFVAEKLGMSRTDAILKGIGILKERLENE